MAQQLRPTPAGLLEAFRAYEQALMSNDLEALDRLFAPGPATLRGDANGLLVGHDAISRFRGARGGAPRRTIVQTHVQVIDDDHALIVAVTELGRGGRGLQTQLWARSEVGEWQVTAAQVSVPPPAYDGRVWRLVGDPLVPATTDDGPLSGETVAVKDLYAVAGQRVGAGNPEWLRHAQPEPAHAAAVARLLDAGATIRGIARTDEFAYSLAGLNAHYGAPPNPKAPYRIPGGSSNGSASAVSLGHASVGLGTDTGGSIRVPAAYQGLYGIRTTHGAVDRSGLLPLAPSFDTVGWLTRSAFLLQAVGDVLLPEPDAAATTGSTRVVTVPALLGLAESDVAAAVRDASPADAASEDWPLEDLLGERSTWLSAFQTWQAYEAWQAHGEWLATRLDTLGADVRGRFERARDTSEEVAQQAKATVDEARDRIRELVGDRILALPSAASVAPLPAHAQAARDATMRLTCLAGLGGLPAVSVPARTLRGLPAGLCLVAAPGRDRDLLAYAVDLAERSSRPA
ncbi:AtzH-like domain-containing protein [Nocardioides cheoyonin]|uniref:AtzH-like domain-containing protein n=1 Tax=Nocardioides cheoyonin TaxID=3156615 RepID=UPI0032B584F2